MSFHGLSCRVIRFRGAYTDVTCCVVGHALSRCTHTHTHTPYGPFARLPLEVYTGFCQYVNEKKHSEETQTLHAGCSKAEPKIFTPPQTPSRGGGAERPKFNQLEMVTTFTYTNSVWWGSMHTISSYRGNRPTNTATNPQTNRQDRLQYTALQLWRSVNCIRQNCWRAAEFFHFIPEYFRADEGGSRSWTT